MKPFVTIVVVTKNEELYISDCLKSLFNLKYPQDRFEVIVIDGDSSDQTRQIAYKFPVILKIDKTGLGHSRNLGLIESKGVYIASTDADCVVKPDWLDNLVEEMEKAPNNVIAVGGPNLVFENDPSFSKIVGYLQETFFSSGGAPQSYKISQKKFVFGIPNCNVMYKREKLIEEGGFNENINMGEDAELNSRLTKRGYVYLYIPDAIVWHHRPITYKQFVKRMYTYGRGMGYLMRQKKVLRWYPFLPSIAICALLLAYPIIVLFPISLYFYTIAILMYFFATIFTIFFVYKKFPHLMSLVTLILLPTQHFTYGIGFLSGFIKRN